MKYLIPLFFPLLLLLTACEKQQADNDPVSLNQNEHQHQSTEEVNTADDDQKIAKVGDWFITQQELDFVTERTVGSSTLAVMYDQIGVKLLESLVVSKAMAQQASAALSVDEKTALELKVKAYREELLVRQYLADNAKVEPVTDQMIQDYYQKHPEKFGGITRKRYRLIKTINLPANKLTEASELFSEISQNSNWQEAVAELKKQNIIASIQTAEVNPALISDGIKKLLEGTAQGQLSPVTVVNGNLYRLEVVAEIKTPAKTLVAVSDEIRKILAPLQLKQAVKTASEEAVKDLKVEYL
ncbi:peptidyl-prolyl cis-trans isomerase [Endozoicomonas sp. SM1973]|uniref:Peptidyl-prolyl cis-trans isomerase n=1 Tax=Spartinivicinus marinus TaxID=2994442 RepID=A0A853I633_9GAMM|nr:peptidyl-prolyl cis-trans isomerase [Spartinivicinus marinus]MCX4028259.1 peptidyl-prolyl cis-trans isomerase [Spartinivicinus marinus]NYZ65594.1 peptidyl-prolyl cis-trans isomerase [Spartinivicinus marinus]